jgi:hypothetical protein
METATSRLCSSVRVGWGGGWGGGGGRARPSQLLRNSQFPATVNAQTAVVGFGPASRGCGPVRADAHVRLVNAQRAQPRWVAHDSHLERPVRSSRGVVVRLVERREEEFTRHRGVHRPVCRVTFYVARGRVHHLKKVLQSRWRATEGGREAAKRPSMRCAFVQACRCIQRYSQEA